MKNYLFYVVWAVFCLIIRCSSSGVVPPAGDTKDAVEIKDVADAVDLADTKEDLKEKDADAVEDLEDIELEDTMEIEEIKEIEAVEDVEAEGGKDVTEDVTPECPGGAYCECEENSECDSDFCVEGEDGRVCSELCNTKDNCEEGWECEEVQSSPDTIFACVYPHAMIWKPCQEDTDCKASYITDSSQQCVEFGGNGKFCTSECVKDIDCPENYVCASDLSVCYPEKVEWNCKEIFEGEKTECYVKNDLGTCYGERICQQGKLTDCDAKTPEEESCDDIDNDCDNEIDNEAKDCKLYYKDIDGDGYGSEKKCLCKPDEEFTTLKGGDCDEEAKEINPEATEICNGIDDNCNNKADEGCPPTSVSVVFSTVGISGKSDNYKIFGAGGSTSQAGKSEGEYILNLGFFPMAAK